MPDYGPHDIFHMPVNTGPFPRMLTPALPVTRPLVPIRAPQPVRPPLCDVSLILERHYTARSLTPLAQPILRPDSQVLPIDDCYIPPSAYVDHSFIQFEPTFKVTVSEVAPYKLELRKPRTERFRRSIASIFKGDSHGEVRFSTAIHAD